MSGIKEQYQQDLAKDILVRGLFKLHSLKLQMSNLNKYVHEIDKVAGLMRHNLGAPHFPTSGSGTSACIVSALAIHYFN
eukprot:10556256-Karenia_brevis.AAC.1